MAITSVTTEKEKEQGPVLGLQAKFALTYILLMAAVLFFLNTYPVLASQSLVFQSKRDSLQSQAALLSSGLAGLDSVTADGAGQVMEQLSLQNITQLVITDGEGIIVYDTDRSAGTIGAPCDWPELRRALSGSEDVFRSRFAGGAFQTYAAAPVTVGGRVTGGVCLFEYDTAQAQLILGIQSTLRNISLAVSALAILVSLILSRVLTGRVGALLEAIRRVREGEYSHRAEVKGHDELRQLGEEFNRLTDRLQTTEEVRRRFVSDASHELKTPLASIRLLTDSILQSDNIDPDTTREFIGDIGQEADRLTRITEDLLALTRMDAKAVPKAPQSTPMAPVLRRAAHMLEPLAARSQVTFALTLDEDCAAPCGEDDLYQIVFNLMENAVKYNLPGGQVALTLSRDDAGITLAVADTGVGIPRDELSKIFDRFYRVDKARSRAAGGTGLGLSIARDTARVHGGDLTAQPREGEQGTVFLLTFPRRS